VDLAAQVRPTVAQGSVRMERALLPRSGLSAVESHVTGTVELVATDVARTWVVDTIRWSGQAWGQEFHDQPGCVRSAVGTPEATVSGTAEDLDLLVWTRADRGIVRAGDERILAEFQAVLVQGIQ